MDGEGGGGGDGGTFDAKYLKYIEAVLLIRYLYFQRYIGTALGPLHQALHRNSAYRGSVFTFLYVYHRPNLERAVKGRYPLVLSVL